VSGEFAPSVTAIFAPEKTMSETTKTTAQNGAKIPPKNAVNVDTWGVQDGEK